MRRIERGGDSGSRKAAPEIDWDLFAEFDQRLKPVIEQAYGTPTITAPTAYIREKAKEIYDALLASKRSLALTVTDRESLFEAMMAEAVGVGPLEMLLADDTISAIMVNGPYHIWVEQNGNLSRTDIAFRDDDHVMKIITRIVTPVAGWLDPNAPVYHSRLPDGSRVTAVVRPVSPGGPSLMIRKSSRRPLTVDDLINLGTMTPDARDFLRAAIIARLNIIISGGSGSGKTTLINVLSSFIPNDERLVTVERVAEYQLRQEHVLTLESRPPDRDGNGEVTMSELVDIAIGLAPDRLIFGTITGGEALPVLYAFNSGHDGSIASVHSNSPRDTLARLEGLCLMSGIDVPVRVLRELFASAIDLIVHMERLPDGTRKIVKITEVNGIEREVITSSDIFEFEQTGLEGGKVIGRIRPTGLRPTFMARIEAAGVHLPSSIFGVGSGISTPPPIPTRRSSPTTPIRQPRWTITTGDEIRCAPAASRDTVFVGSYDQHIYGIELSTGAALWTFAANGGIASSPVVDERSGLLYFGSEDGQCYCLELFGHKVWSFQTNGSIRSTARLAHDHVWFGSDDGFIYVTTAQDGKFAWRYDIAAPVRTCPFVTDQRCIVGADNGELVGLELAGNRIWGFNTDSRITASPFVNGGICYVGTSDGYLYAVEANNGFLAWRYRAGGAIFASPVVANGLLYFASSNKTVYALDATNSRERWKFSTEGAVVAAPVVHDGALYIGSTDGRFYCLDARTGQERWRSQTNGPITGAACITSELALVGSMDGTLYALPLDD
jgi:pilus assembly protein CpaF